MRKPSSRKPRPLKKYLTPMEHRSLVTTAHMAVSLLLSGQAERSQLAVILGFLNLGSALAHFAFDDAFMLHVRSAQMILARLDSVQTTHYCLESGDDADLIVAVVAAIDKFLKKTYKYEVEEAINYVTAALEGKHRDTADVVGLGQLK